MKTIKNIFWLYKPYLKYGKLFVFLSLLFWAVIMPIAQLVGVYLPSTIINMLENNKPFSDIVVLVIGLQLILMFQPMYEDLFNMFCKNKALPTIEAKIKYNVYDKAIKTDYKYIDNPDYYDNYTLAVGEYANKAAEAQNLVDRMVSSIIIIISMLSIIAILSPLAVIVTVIGTIIENIMYMITNYFDVKKEVELVPHDRKLGYYHRIFYMNNFAADLKSTSIKNHLFKGFDEAQKNKLNIIKKYALKMIPWSLMGNLTFYIARTFVILNIAYGIYSGNIETIGTYITMMVAVETLKNALNEMFYYVKDANKLGMYAKKIRAFFEVKSEIENDINNKLEAPNSNYSVRFENVNFNYENSDFHIKDFNLEIYSGEKIAIVGENGVGKSTLVKLLLRFYDVNSGAISIDDKNIKEYNKNQLRRIIGVAFQQPNIYAMSLADNINIYGKINDDKLKSIISKSGLEKILIKNNADTSTELTREFNDNGIMLSGGEVQKIGIARLLCQNFGLLLFDEPSSSLDPLTEYDMTKLILDSSNLSTTIIVAHRLSTIRNVDRIVVVDDGTIKEVGTHNELMKMQGKYYEMFTKQAENYIT